MMLLFVSFFLWFFQVTVSTKSAKSDKQYVWEGEANTSSYTVQEETDAEKMVPRGTVITLYLKVISGSNLFAIFRGISGRFVRIIACWHAEIERKDE
jgi:hypothetical protein